jgi:large subunit ribosomal protein L10
LAINKEKKEQLVAAYKELLGESSALIMTSYSGVTVKQLEVVRRKIRELGGEFHIVKNTLFSLVMNEAGISLPEDTYIGTTAIGFALEEIPGVAKAIVDLSRDVESVNIKGGLIENVVYDAAQIELLADLPPLPVLRAQLLSVVQAPASRIAMTFAGSVRQLVNVTNAYADSGEATAAAPA